MRRELTEEEVANLTPEEVERREKTGEDMFRLVDKIAHTALSASPPGQRQQWASREIEGVRQEMLSNEMNPDHADRFCKELGDFVAQAIRLLEVHGGGTAGHA
jgi:hypothetical protein